MNEVWKPVAGYESSYEVSSLGQVRSIDRVAMKSNGVSHTVRGKTMKQVKEKCGYMRVHLCVDRKLCGILAHRLVATAFVPNPGSLPYVNHIDGDKSNNASDNLEWVTRQENAMHSIAIGLQKTSLAPRQVEEIRRLKSHGVGTNAVAKMFGTSPANVCHIVNRDTWRQLD